MLVLGCGYIDDALRGGKLAADARAFDRRPDALQIAKHGIAKVGLPIHLEEMRAARVP